MVGRAPGVVGGGKAAGIDEAILGLDEEELLAFDVVHFGPVNRDTAGSVIEADGKRIGIEAFDFTSKAVAIAHDERVGLFTSGHRQNEQQQNVRKKYFGIHGGQVFPIAR